MSGAKVVAQARLWIGTPYHHQASVRGAGCDCLGLIRGVWREIYGPEPEAPPAYSADWGEVGGAELLAQAAARHLVPKAPHDAALGDVLLFRPRRGAVAKHLGLQASLGPQATMIHAVMGRAVAEVPLHPHWSGVLAGRFTFPKIGD